jgi:hypothetical protein
MRTPHPGTPGPVRAGLALALGLALVALHTGFFGSWLVDDAGITFAYARTLAAGHGFTAQPGTPPVEGFSNPLWTLVVAGLYAVKAFHLPWTSKIVSLLFTAAPFWLIWRDLRDRTGSSLLLALPLVFLASNTAFVVWTTSGLENALLAALAATICTITIRRVDQGGDARRLDILAGAVAALMALTRPDALVYLGIHPLATAVALAMAGHSAVSRTIRSWLATAGGFVPLFGGYLLFRVLYFGAWAPNTYYAKAKPSVANLFDVGKLLDLVEAGVGDVLWLALAAGAATLLLLAWRRRLTAATLVRTAYLATAAAVYLLMPRDWMGEFRFATPFFVFLPWWMAGLAADAGATLTLRPAARLAAAAAGIVIAAQFAVIAAARSTVFRDTPTLPLAVVQEFGAEGFDRLAAVLPDRRASLLTPDLGGVLLDSELRIYDLAGLCDREIARALAAPGDLPRLHEYVFGQIRPTFIHTHGAFTRASRLHEDPRFARDYVAIHESHDAPAAWRTMWPGGAVLPPWSGDYVRRDALTTPGQLDALLAEYRRQRMETFAIEPGEAPRLRSGWPQVRWAIRRLATAARDRH